MPVQPRRQLSHIDSSGHASMVDIGEKADTEREAVAKGSVYMNAETLSLIVSGGMAKGDTLATAQLAGVMAAKRTPELIPLCHPLLLTKVDVSLEPDRQAGAIHITARVWSTGKTGVEMEAAHRRVGCCPDCLRHVQGCSEGHAYRQSPLGPKAGRQERRHRSGIGPRTRASSGPVPLL